ncbi:hypothetical protein [Streptomyces sp. CFMR 7]|uniref:hypothetical protein n=1 Tax=Streptomyces sp. CFMR 7 TaxID=1649184 RepID=UPI00099DB048|nr:hypothetical protein [Streptomyces sp. CFMR 7]
MRLKALMVAAAAAGALVFSASPASAAANWQAVNTNSNWDCLPYKTHTISANIKFKPCVVTNANNHTQVVLVIQHTGTAAAIVSGEIVSSFGSNTLCNSSTFNPGFTRGCYAPTVNVPSSGGGSFNVRLNVNGTSNWYA